MTDNITTTEEDATSGLKTKNAELIGKLKKADEAAKALTERLEALEAAQNDAADATKSEVERERTKFERELKKRDDQLAKLNGELSTLKIDNVIGDAITKAGVLPHHADILTAFLKNGAKMENGEATVNGVPLVDHVSGFFSSDAAKHYVAAPTNSGAGAQGSQTSATNSGGFTKDNLTLTAFSKIAKEQGADVANSIATSVGSNLRA